MSDTSQRHMVEMYMDDATPMLFFSGMFQTPARNFFPGEEVEFDVRRGKESVAVAFRNLAEGYHWNTFDKGTNKKFTPPAYREAFMLEAFRLLKREIGKDPYEAVTEIDWQRRANEEVFTDAREVEAMVRRGVELQAAQVLQTGKLDLKDYGGDTVYELDFKPKSTHFPTAGTAWDASGADPIGDLWSLSKVIRKDGLAKAEMVCFGSKAWNAFYQHDSVKTILDNRRINLGDVVAPEMRGEGGVFVGRFVIGDKLMDLWTYDGTYDDPETGTKKYYMDEGKVIMKPYDNRLDLFYGMVPILRGPLPNMPRSLSSRDLGLGMYLNAWYSDDGESLKVGVSSRPLCVPTAIDTFGCLTTGV